MMSTTARPAKAVPTYTATIATATNKLPGARCSVCRRTVVDLDTVILTPGATRPAHFACAPASARATFATAPEAEQCWYGTADNPCPFPQADVASHCCRVHHTELYGAPRRKQRPAAPSRG